MTIGDDEMRRERERERQKRRMARTFPRHQRCLEERKFFRKIAQMPPSLQRRANISVV